MEMLCTPLIVSPTLSGLLPGMKMNVESLTKYVSTFQSQRKRCCTIIYPSTYTTTNTVWKNIIM